MPAGPSMIGAGAFVAVKLVGYGLAGRRLNDAYAQVRRVSPSLFGVARTVLGIGVGVSFALVVSRWAVTSSTPLWYVALLPVRVCEWMLVIWLFYERARARPDWKRLLWLSFLGTLWSYALDLPAALSVIVVPGGMWVC